MSDISTYTSLRGGEADAAIQYTTTHSSSCGLTAGSSLASRLDPAIKSQGDGIGIGIDKFRGWIATLPMVARNDGGWRVNV